MNNFEKAVWNEGERLLPYKSHNNDELVRHRSSYVFFREVIQNDVQEAKFENLKIVDLGSGTGYGSAILAGIAGSEIVAVDNCEICFEYSKSHYPRGNVRYENADLADYIPVMPEFDYSVSRGVMEHVPGGVELIKKIRSRCRTIVDVPYDEDEGNPHHLVHGIVESDFDGLDNVEYLYEDINGAIYCDKPENAKVNMLLLVISKNGMAPVKSMFKFPIPPVHEPRYEVDSEIVNSRDVWNYSSRAEFLLEAEHHIRKTDVVLDVGAGIRPMAYFRPKIHIMVEPWGQYADILQYRFRDDKSVFVVRGFAMPVLSALSDASVDSIFLLDVIEHLTKEDGYGLLVECTRVCRDQVVVFTPHGFMPQEVEAGQKDGWGLDGGQLQEHLSGWHPGDFGAFWSFHVCEGFHKSIGSNGIETSYGAMFAIYNSPIKRIPEPTLDSDVREPLPSEVEASELRALLCMAEEQLNASREHVAKIEGSIVYRILSRFRNQIRSMIGAG